MVISFEVRPDRIGLYILPFALSNFLGPRLRGRLFDTIGRRPMIGGTYTISAVLLAVSGYLFQANLLSATTQTILWATVFFFVSAAASSGEAEGVRGMQKGVRYYSDW